MAPEGKHAFDVYYWPPAYSDGVNVYVNTTGIIRGAIEYACVNDEAEDACNKKTSLVIENAVLEDSKLETKLMTPNIKIVRSLFADEAAAAAWIPAGYKLITDGDYYGISLPTVASQEELNAAVAQENATIVVPAGTFTAPASVADGVTIEGVAGTVIDIPTAVAYHNKNLTFKDVTMKSPNADYTGIQHAASIKYVDCTIEGQPFSYAETAVFEGCTFNQTSSDAYNIWTYGSTNITFNDCVFNCAGKGVLIYNEGSINKEVATFNNCKFIATTPVTGKAAIEIDSRFTSYEVYINGCTHDGFANGSVSGNSLWNKKAGDKSVKVFVDGTQVL